jgi:3-methyl-2-oxobutanoate hydroxymethyltransferase
MAEKITAPKIRAMKGGRIVCVTAYDAPSARIADDAGVDVVLVGDSVGNVVLGYENTLPVTLGEMLHHVRAAAKGAKRALLVADLPFGTFQASADDAIRAGIELVKAGAEAVKLEGPYTDAISGLVRAGVPVMGHVGMTPQSVNVFGGFKVQGRGQQADAVLSASQAIAHAGAFAIVLEVVPGDVAARITEQVTIPTIGIGAGSECDGEVQVFHDILGLSPEEPYKHSKRFLNAYQEMRDAIGRYADDVRNCRFPTDENTF